MPLYLTSLPGSATGNIMPSVFVTPDPGKFCGYKQCVASDIPIGISQDGTRDAPTPTSLAYAAQAGDELEIFFLGDVCMLTAGTGGWTNGDQLKPDANGCGVTAATTNKTIGAVALSTITAGELGQALIRNLNF